VPRGPDHPRDGLEPTERRLLEALLIRKPLPPEAVAARAGVAVRDALRILPGLAFRGLARRNPDGFVVVRSPDRPPGPGPGPDAGAGGAAA
jgi:DNA processing protein